MHIRTLSESQRCDWLRLARSENIGPRTFVDLIARFPEPSDAIEALPELSRRAFRNRRLKICDPRMAQWELDTVRQIGGRTLALCEPDYPFRLRHIPDPPPVIHVVGEPALAARPVLAIVGSRNATVGGRKIARQIAREAGRAGLTIVSGLARGIDTAAHEASLDTGTIAVLATGPEHVYPPENEGIYREISQNGAIVSEMPPGTKPLARHFPRRNRIVSGLAAGVLVVEAAQRSGSLITARLAAEQGRDVFAVPGSPLDARSAGSNALIRDGAELVTCADDILAAMAAFTHRPDALPLHPVRSSLVESPTPTEPEALAVVAQSERDRILALLGHTPVAVDALIQESGLPASTVQTVLLELDIGGLLSREGHGFVGLCEPAELMAYH